MFFKKLSTIFMLVLLLTQATLAQSSMRLVDSDAAQPPPQTESVKKGLNLLEEIATEARAMRLPENRAFIQAAAADLLWSYDDQRARALFTEALSNLDSLPAELTEDDPERAELERSAEELRAEVLNKAAMHDLSWARRLMRSAPRAEAPVEDELELYLSSAWEAALRDPPYAVRVAIESLDRGFSTRLPNLVARLKERDGEAAAKLSSALVIRLLQQNLATDEEAASVALGLLHLVVESPANSAETTATTNSNVPPLLDQQQTRNLVELLLSAALDARAANSNLLLSMSTMLSEIEHYAPARAALLRRKLAQPDRLSKPQPQASSDTFSREASLEELLQAAPKAPPETRDELYSEAVTRAQNAEDFGRARQLAGNIADPYQRREILASIIRDDLLNNAKAGKAEQILGSLNSLPTPEERASILVQLAKALARKNQLQQAREVLSLARSQMNTPARNFPQLKAQLTIACALAMIDTDQGFVMLETIIGQLDDLASAASVIDGFITEEPLTRMTELRLTSIKRLLDAQTDESDLNGALTLLSNTAFDRVKNLIDRFQHPELRALARLALACAILTEQAVGQRR